jgi:beta-phosphoglucomutase
MLDIPNTVKAIFFDLNGTLLRDQTAHDLAFQELFEREGIHLSKNQYIQKVGNTLNRLIWPSVFQRQLADEEITHLSREKEERYLKLLPFEGRVTRGIYHLLDSLSSAELTSALVNTSPRETVDAVLTKLDLNGQFDPILSGEDILNGKPDPEIYLLALRKINLISAQVIAFEDSPKGVLSATAAGIKTVGVLSEHDEKELLANGAYCCINDFTEVVVVK